MENEGSTQIRKEINGKVRKYMNKDASQGKTARSVLIGQLTAGHGQYSCWTGQLIVLTVASHAACPCACAQLRAPAPAYELQVTRM